MKFVKAVLKVANPEPLIYLGDGENWVVAKAEEKKMSIAEALDVLVDHGLGIKNLHMAANYDSDGMEIDLALTIVPDPQKCSETMSAFNDWYVSKTYYGKAKD